MKRAMTLIVVMAVLLFTQLALAEVEFRPGELTLIWGGEVQDQGLTDQQLAAAGLKIVPLQAYTHLTSNLDERTQAWVLLDEEFYKTATFRAYNSGDLKVKIKITDVKTGKSIKYDYGTIPITEGFWWFSVGPSSFSGPSVGLPRIFQITFILKVGIISKSVSTKIILY
jgi:hypothetical protein